MERFVGTGTHHEVDGIRLLCPRRRLLATGHLHRVDQNHPAQTPVLVAEVPIRNHTKPGDAVYDPFLGSGTPLIAAERMRGPATVSRLTPCPAT
jgi:hypothetical protein